ncbi:MAG: ATP synthase F0 subunit B [Nitrospirota bacterium]
MLDIKILWFLVLLVNFLGLIFILNIILFKPVLKIFQERKDTVKSSLDAARDMNSRKEDGMAGLNREIADARNKAKETFESLKNEGLDLQKKLLSEAEANAAGMLQKAREELKAEAAKARQALKADVEKFSDEIVRKLVKA